MLIIGVEGTSLAGKTTVSKHLRSALKNNALLVPEFMYFVFPGAIMPPVVPHSKEEQLGILHFYADINLKRMQLALAQIEQVDVVFLDRTVETMIAHLYALDLWGPEFLNECWEYIQETLHRAPTPDATICLATSPTIVAERALSEGNRPSLFSEPGFVRRFNEYFKEKRLAPWPCHFVDGDRPPDEVANECLRRLEPIGLNGRDLTQMESLE